MQSIHSHHYRHVIEKLVEARIAAGMTQMAMAKAWGRNQSIIAKIETCERRIDVVEFLSLCRLVNLDPIPVLQQVQAAMASE